MSAADWWILAIAGAVVIGSIVAAIRRRKQGRSSCGGDCAHCGGCAANDETKRGNDTCSHD